MPDRLQEEIEGNYKAFMEQLPALLSTHAGKFALMRHAEIVEYFDTARDAVTAGERLFSDDRLFSVQEVIETPADLGYFSHAVP